MNSVLQRIERNGLAWYAFTGPDPVFRHAMLTRLGGVSQAPFAALNLGSTCGDDPEAVAENYRRVLEAFDLTPDVVVTPHQVHGKAIAHVGRAQGGKVIPDTDGLLTQESGVALLLRFADCVPVLMVDREHHAIGLAHAGWRGVVAGVVPALISALIQRIGSQPERLWAGIGPAIGPDAYAVGPEVVTAVTRTLPANCSVAEYRAGQWFLNLPAAVEGQLRTLGVSTVEQSGLDTAGRVDEWYSHRAEKGRTGRFGVLITLT